MTGATVPCRRDARDGRPERMLMSEGTAPRFGERLDPSTPAGPPPPDAADPWLPTAPDGDPAATASPPPTASDSEAAEAARAVAASARDEAADVAATTREEARRTADVAAEKTRETVGEAREQARALYEHTLAVVTEQAATQQRTLAGTLTSVAGELEGLSEGRPGDGPATAFVRDASRYARDAADWLDARSPDDVLAEVSRYARRHPGRFLAIAAGLGVLAGRFVRAMKDGEDRGDTTPIRAGAVGRPAVGEGPAVVAGAVGLGGERVSGAETVVAPPEPTPGVLPPTGTDAVGSGGIPARRFP
jgi:hypothetical protein